ncbi:Catenin-beta-like protein [Thelonectria olida]|uniref:Catenin-beta-like protein n=1 Tax=Thelonectria olida TaxID=1576542 RepID=A0A9P8WD68_9HYPO|nr:Catenin-beta-like protein [Thelonectria olida]
MASVDDIFKNAGVSSKRKLDPVRDPNEIYKSAKRNANNANRHARVDDEEEDGLEAGPAPPPDENEDFGPDLPPDDDEGRFFGGGITQQESEILDFVEDADAKVAPEKINAAWLRKTALNFEKLITRNAELRAKFEDEPQKFISSEADLDADIKGLSVLSQHPELYPEFVRTGCVGSLVSLLAHENTDIAIDAMEVIEELTDEEVVSDESEWEKLVNALLDSDVLGLLVSNFSRLNEDDESDRSGVYHALSVIENFCLRKQVAERVGEGQNLIEWLLERIQRKESPVTQNKQYSTEILAILAQASIVNRSQLIRLDAIDQLLQLVAPYRRRDPEKGSDEEEYMENLFGCLTSLVDEETGKSKFIEAEGVELCLIMLKEGKKSKWPALRLIDHAVGGNSGIEMCQKVVEAGGLKTLFTLFMKTSSRPMMESLIAIFATMLRLLPANSAERIRLLAKFVEKDYTKTAKLFKIRQVYRAQLAQVENRKKQESRDLTAENIEEMEVGWMLDMIAEGIFTSQHIDQVLAWLVAEDTGARKKIKDLLAEGGDGLEVIGATLKEQLKGLDTTEKNKDMGDMLSTLVEFVQ